MDMISWIYLTIGGTVLFGLIAFIFNAMLFKHIIVVRHVANERTLIKMDKGRIYKDRFGNKWLKLRKHREKVFVPPKDITDLTTKGKYFIELERYEDGNFVYLEHNPERERGMTIKEGFKHFDTDQRALLIQEFRDAEDWKKKKFSDLLAIAMPYTAMIIIVAVVLIFWGEAIQPMLEINDQIGGTLDKFDSITAKQQAILTNQQFLGGQDLLVEPPD